MEYEYKVLDMEELAVLGGYRKVERITFAKNREEILNGLNILGKDGWKLVQIKDSFLYFFSRKRRSKGIMYLFGILYNIILINY